MKKKTILFLGLALLTFQTPSLNAQSLIEQYFAKMAEPLKQFETVGEYTYFEEMVEGGDGFKLLTRIYLPEGEGPWPVVVTRTPYVYFGRGDNNAIGREYARRGIGYIQQIGRASCRERV